MAILKNVLIIDDQLDEVDDIREAFLQNNYIPVVVDPAESNKVLYTPDIICCDINLSATNKEQNFKTIAGILKKIFKHNKLYIFVAWTNKSDLFSELEAYLSADTSIIQPLKYICFSKENFDLHCFEEKLGTLYNENKGLISLYDWNEIVLDSLDNLTYNICSIAKDNSCSIQNILSSLGEKTAGKHFLENKTKTICTFLHLLLEDEIDSTIKFLNDASEKFNDIDGTSESTNIPAEKLNSALLFSKNTSTSLEVGDFIRLDSSCFMKIRHFIERNTRKQIKKDIKDNIQKIDGLDIDKCTWGLINITADCDYSNKKQGVDKFVFACIAKYNHADEKTRIVSPSLIMYRFYDKETDENKALIIHSKYIFGGCLNNLKNCTKYFRIRKQLLISIRQQIYAYNSRIGTISF